MLRFYRGGKRKREMVDTVALPGPEIKIGLSGWEMLGLGLLASVAFSAAWWGLYRFLKYHGAVSWSRAVAAVKDVAQEMKADGFEPTIVLGVGRGGAVLAALMGGHFRDVFVLTSRRRRGGSSYSREDGELPGAAKMDALVAALTAAGMSDVRVLVVADTAYEGSTFSKYLEFLGERKNLHVRTFAYAVQPRGQQFADYKAVETRSRLTFPWTEKLRRHGRDFAD